MTVTTNVTVEGMTCGHCVKAVTDEISGLDGVNDVTVDLVVNGLSTVTISADKTLQREDLAGAVSEAGYVLVEATHLS